MTTQNLSHPTRSRSAPPFRNEPPADFAVEENRRQMRDALGAVAQGLGEIIRW